MKKFELNIGGELAPGDVVGVSYNNYVQFGWYVEEGQYGSLKFIPLRTPANIEIEFDNFTSGKSGAQAWLQKKYASGITFKHMSKDFITSWSDVNNRAFKVSNPEEFFKGAGETEKVYLAGKQVLNNLKFPAK